MRVRTTVICDADGRETKSTTIRLTYEDVVYILGNGFDAIVDDDGDYYRVEVDLPD